MICERFDVVVVPFPFVDRPAVKRRPALVVSHGGFNSAGHTVLAMITTKAHPPWPGDCRIEKYRDAGLRVPCIVRLKLFTLDNRLLIRTLGRLTEADAARVQDFLRDSLI